MRKDWAVWVSSAMGTFARCHLHPRQAPRYPYHTSSHGCIWAWYYLWRWTEHCSPGDSDTCTSRLYGEHVASWILTGSSCNLPTCRHPRRKTKCSVKALSGSLSRRQSGHILYHQTPWQCQDRKLTRNKSRCTWSVLSLVSYSAQGNHVDDNLLGRIWTRSFHN